MKKNIRKELILIVVFIMLFIIMMPIKTQAASTSDYYISSYDVDIVVNENNVYDITETITTYFNVAKHGIYRKIPITNTVKRTDGTTSKTRAKISNISVDNKYSVTTEDGYRKIQIGDANTTLTGEHTYVIKYSYDLGKDVLKDADEFYFNIIGSEWDTTISNVTFKITMPKEFDESLLGFSSGYSYTTGSKEVQYTVNENVITGQLTGTLSAGQALTARLTLPEGYFVGASNFDLYYYIGVIAIGIIFIIIAFGLWSKYGKDNEVIETVEFYPPEGYNSAEIGYIYAKNSDKGIISLLIYLADKGYLKIEETKKRIKSGFILTKLKEYDGNNKDEATFFNGLFNGKDTVTDKDLYDKFYVTINKIKISQRKNENLNQKIENKNTGKVAIVVIMIIALLALITVKPFADVGDAESIIIAMLFPIIGIATICAVLFSNSSTGAKVFGIIFGLFLGVSPIALYVIPILTGNTIAIVTYCIGMAFVLILSIFIKIMPQRTKYGTELYGKIKGFKRFLETAEKGQLEALVAENPKYFYNILPYTYALGVSDVWIKQFESIALQAPDWYVSSSDVFTIHEFNSFMTHTMKSASTAMTSSPSSDGGSSGGGGFSGGGSGGGGGGSW